MSSLDFGRISFGHLFGHHKNLQIYLSLFWFLFFEQLIYTFLSVEL